MESGTAGATAEADPFAAPEVDPFAGGDDQPPVVNKEGEIIEDPDVGGDAGAVPPVPEPEPATPAAQEPQATEPVAAPAAPEVSDGGAQAGAGAATEGGKSPMRQYHILYQTAPDQWTEAEWQEDGKPTKVCKARNNDHALRLAFGILGEPEAGVTVLPVPVSSFKPKRLKRKAVVPRTALDIS